MTSVWGIEGIAPSI